MGSAARTNAVREPFRYGFIILDKFRVAFVTQATRGKASVE